MNLYQIDETINQIIENGFAVDEETGEITFDEFNLEQLELDKNEKLENIACFIKNLSAEVAAIKEEEKNLAQRRKSKETKAENLKTYLSNFLLGIGQEKFESSKAAISFRKSQTLEVSDIAKIPEDFLRYKDPEVNKTDLKKAIQGGLEVEGAEIVEKKSIQIK